MKISTALHPCVLGITYLDTVLRYKQNTDFVVIHAVEVSNRYKDGNMALWNLRTALLLLLASTLTAGETVNGATGAINDTVPTTFENEATVYTIQVGKEKETYTPNSINPGPGDIISFVFYSGNHSVIKAEYGYPCIPYENLEGNEGQGFYSGIFSVTDEQVEQGDVSAWRRPGFGQVEC